MNLKQDGQLTLTPWGQPASHKFSFISSAEKEISNSRRNKMFNESFLTKEDVSAQQSSSITCSCGDAESRVTSQPGASCQRCTANCEPLRKFDLFFTLSDYRREQRGPERCSESREKHNGQLQNWKSELQIDAISPSTVITRLEIIDCERMSMMP